MALAACAGSSKPSTGKSRRHKPVAPTSTTTTTRPPINYTVKRGDTLTSLARFFGVSIATLASTNHLSTTATLTAGQMLVIPPRAPVQLLVSPGDGTAGTPFTFTLSGAQANEAITFQVVAPGGGKFTGPPHTAAPDGSVTAMYQSSTANNAGTYIVLATGNQGSSAQAMFRIDVTPPPS